MAAGGGGRLGGAAETFPVTTTDLEGVLAGGGVLAVEGALGGEGALVAEEGSKDQVTLVKQVRKTRKFVFRKSIRHTYYMMYNKNLFRVLCIVCFLCCKHKEISWPICALHAETSQLYAFCFVQYLLPQKKCIVREITVTRLDYDFQKYMNIEIRTFTQCMTSLESNTNTCKNWSPNISSTPPYCVCIIK